MDKGARDIYTDPLFVGLTRPTTVWGVPYGALIAELLAVAVIFIGIGNPLYLLLAVPIHAVLYLVSAHDPGIFSSMGVWLITNARGNHNAGFWKAVSFSPLSTKKWSE